MSNPHHLNILIGGEAGQGLVTVGTILSRVLARWGLEVQANQTYLSRIRGGHNTFQISGGRDRPRSPAETFHLILALDRETVPLHRPQLLQGGVILADASRMDGSPHGVVSLPTQELGSSRTANIAVMGAAMAALGAPLQLAEEEIRRAFHGGDPKVVDDNLAALRAAHRWAQERRLPRPMAITPPEERPRRMMMTGNEAIGLGALASGLKFCCYYPMTPATSICLTVTRFMEEMGCIVEQAEDEIAAINMALGASFAGAPAMVATSGGGFALMTEAVSLAGMTETPLVIAIAQRPGPATGLPTRTEQADLFLALHAGHGEFPRAIFAPSTVEECYSITQRAFDQAERFQTPVFVLTDQFLADTLATIPPLEAPSGQVGAAPASPDQVDVPYRRYRITPDGISPRLLPGLSQHLVRADSDEHNEEGVIEESPTNRILMHEKRLKKGKEMAREALEPHLHGDPEAQVVLVCWGSSRGPVEETVDLLRQEGIAAASLSFSQVWPLATGELERWRSKGARFIFVEGNATGQLARVVLQETGLEAAGLVNRYDGLPFTTEYIVNALKGII